MKSKRSFLKLVCLTLPTLALPAMSHADIGLMVYDAILADPYLTSAGHAGVYLSNVCMTDTPNQFRVCNDDDKKTGKNGVVVQRYSDMAPGASTKDWIVLPVNVNIYGKEGGKDDAPILSTPKVLGTLRNSAYNNDDLKLNQLMKPVQGKKEDAAPAIPDGNWQYSIGMTAIRSAHVMGLPTKPEEDQRVVDFLNNDKNVSHFSQFFNNCANFANGIFQVAKGKQFNGRGELEDAFLVTPSSDAKAVKKEAQKEDVPYTVSLIQQSPGDLKRSSTPSEMLTTSNSSMAVSLPLHFVPEAGYVNNTIKYARQLGVPIPGFRPYMDLNKEVKSHATPELADATYDLGHAKKDHDQEQVQNLKDQIRDLQGQTFGNSSCWKDQEKRFMGIINRAISAGIFDPSYQKLFAIHDTKNNLMRMIPYLHMNPSQSKLVSTVADGKDVTISDSSDGLLLEKDGVTAGLTRDNIEKYDQKLGFLIMATSIDFNLAEASSHKPEAVNFDADWELMLNLAKNAGLSMNDSDKVSIDSCVASQTKGQQNQLAGPTCPVQDNSQPAQQALPNLDLITAVASTQLQVQAK